MGCDRAPEVSADRAAMESLDQTFVQAVEDASALLWHSIAWASGPSVAKWLISPSHSCVSTSFI